MLTMGLDVSRDVWVGLGWALMQMLRLWWRLDWAAGRGHVGEWRCRFLRRGHRVRGSYMGQGLYWGSRQLFGVSRSRDDRMKQLIKADSNVKRVMFKSARQSSGYGS